MGSSSGFCLLSPGFKDEAHVCTNGQVHSELRLSFHLRGAFWPTGDTVMNTLNQNPPAVWTALAGSGVGGTGGGIHPAKGLV